MQRHKRLIPERLDNIGEKDGTQGERGGCRAQTIEDESDYEGDHSSYVDLRLPHGSHVNKSRAFFTNFSWVVLFHLLKLKAVRLRLEDLVIWTFCNRCHKRS